MRIESIIFAARSPMPIAILRTNGRFFSIAALNCSAAFASAEPSILSAIFAGVQVAFA